jgi:tRNA (adenine22-N1)-methyltransferase
MTRINTIISEISKVNKVKVIDIGCDHGFCGIQLLNINPKAFIYNIDKNVKPLISCINNYIKHNHNNRAEFFVADSLNVLDKEIVYDYCIISGLGANTIVDIISTSWFSNIKKLIIQANNNQEEIRTLVNDKKWNLYKEIFIKENDYYYNIMMIDTWTKSKISKKDRFLAKIETIQDNRQYKDFLTNRLSSLKQYANEKSRTTNKQIKMIEKRLRVI